jgi:hypothetical protein
MAAQDIQKAFPSNRWVPKQRLFVIGIEGVLAALGSLILKF